MEPTQHPDQNPEEVNTLCQDENAQPKNAETLLEELTADSAGDSIEPVPVLVPDAPDEPTGISEPVAEEVVTAEQEELAEPEVVAEVTAEPQELAEPGVVAEETAKPEELAGQGVVAEETAEPEELAELEVMAEVTTEPEELAGPEVVVEVTAEHEEIAQPEVDAEVTAEPEEIAEPEVVAVITAEPEELAEPEVVAEVPAEPEELAKPEVIMEEVAEPEVQVVQIPVAEETGENIEEAVPSPVLEVVSVVDISDEVENIEEVIEAEVAAAESHGTDYSLMSREELVRLLEETVSDEDVNEIKTKVALLKVAYLALANKERQELYQQAAASEEAENFEMVDPLEERFKAAFNIYKHNKSRYTEDQDKIKLANLEAKKKILDELKVLINSEETLKKTYDEFKNLQELWKGIGMVPKLEAQGLWQNYHFLIEKFFDKVKINKELKDLDLRKNLERKIEICEKAEELVIEPSITKSFKRLQELHEEWKEIGPVAQDKREEVWDRFKSATEKINDRRHDFYKKIQGDFDANYAAKSLLCEKAEQLVATEFNSIRQWQDSTQQVNELLKMWKSIGQAPQKVNNEIWNRFKAHLDQYFSNKKDYFSKLKDQQLHNYNLKVDLCLQAESHRLSSDWKNSSRELIKLQEEWKKIGPVPRKHSDKIWKRFRTACDDFFNIKNEFFKNIQASEGDNLQHKLNIISKLNEFVFSDDRQESLNKVKELQREWMDTGHVPIKDKDRIQAEFKAAVNKIYEKLKVDSQEASNMNYRQRFENVKDQPDAGRIISRERSGLQTKIDSLKEEIMLWENNIGFFARSKQANLLKTEFEGKIARAKEELATLEAKAKFLRNAARDQQ